MKNKSLLLILYATIANIILLSGCKSIVNYPRNYEDIVIAPIFNHGNGLGAIGDNALTFPVLISENEARNIIIARFKEININIDTLDFPALTFKTEPFANHCYSSQNPIYFDMYFKADFYNKKHNLAIQFISRDDFIKFRYNNNCREQIEVVRTKLIANFIREQFIENNKYNLIIFYDPLELIDRKAEKNFKDTIPVKQTYRDVIRQNAINQINKQIDDAIIWLRKEGFIQ